MIYIKSYSPCGFGNKLMDYNLLRQISQKCNIDFSSPSILDTRDFIELGRRPLFFNLKKKNVITKDFIKSIGAINVLKFIQLEIEKGHQIELKTPILGDFFFDFLYQFPGVFINTPSLDVRYEMCGIHFRGGDFLAWNPVAILPIDYYISSIDFVKNYNEGVIFNLFSDDRVHDTFIKIQEYLKSKKYKFNNCINKNFIDDFFLMSYSNILISSPSTFSVMAGCTGKKKKIIHSEAWLNYSINREDKFWMDLSKSNNNFYELWKVL